MDLIDTKVSPADIEEIITCGKRREMKDREIAYEMAGFGGTDTYFRRHRSCATLHDLYSADPNIIAIHLGAFTGVEQAPLLVDIDVTDYRSYCDCDCASQKTTCRRCWPYVQAAMFVISTMLEASFGVGRDKQHWFYSGNRGVHCHVFEDEFLSMTDAQRAGIVRFLDPTISPVRQIFYHQAWPLFKKHFDEVILPAHRESIEAKFGDTLTDTDIIKCAWPKLDTNVTGHRAHMIRLPLTRHPTSKRFSCQIQCSTEDMLSWWPAFLS